MESGKCSESSSDSGHPSTRRDRSRYRSESSPAFRACWESRTPGELFRSSPDQPVPGEAAAVMRRTWHVVQDLAAGSVLYDEDGKIGKAALEQLAQAGYWQLLVDPQYGGCGGSFRSFAPFLTRISTISPSVAGLGSIHGCIGAAALLSEFGDEHQKQRLLPALVTGERLSAFALTEPGAGTDLTSLSATAKRSGDHYLLSGEKLFITNLTMGRTIVCICRIDGEPAALICELPQAETSSCRLTHYGLHVLKHTPNHGIVFRDFPVPSENRLRPEHGNGLTVAYHGLNRGRVALAALASGRMRILLANLVPWCKARWTYGRAIGDRQLVQRRLGRLAARIVACDALVAWCSDLLDRGYRGELECIVAKIFAGEALKFAAVEVFMKTHGGRSFLLGHLFGDDVHDYLAPCIYEGESEMLGLALVRGLAKGYGRTEQPPAERSPADAALAPESAELATAAGSVLARCRYDLIQAIERHGESLIEQQCRMAEISTQFQRAIVLLCTALSTAEQADRIQTLAARVICRELLAEASGQGPSDQDIAAAVQLGSAVLDGQFAAMAGITAAAILQPPMAGLENRS